MTKNKKGNTSSTIVPAMDMQAHMAWAQAWSSISPESSLLAWTDWASHLANSPGKQAELLAFAGSLSEQWMSLLKKSLVSPDQEATPPEPSPTYGRRFNDPAWDQWPYNLYRSSFLIQSKWWEQATQGVWGVDPQHERLLAFGAKQWLELVSPTNSALFNPVVLKKTMEEQGANLARGMSNFLDDLRRQLSGEPPAGTENFVVGRDVAVTEGKVVLRNQLIELIQYTPTTEKVHPEPILIIPAWIMKYYVLDLSPHNSLIRYLVAQGHTVFCISWKNPDAGDRDLGMDEYLELGLCAALDAVTSIVPEQGIHAAGYCLGGTLLSIGASAMARDGDTRLVSVSLLAAQTDFSEPGELGLFINQSQVALLEASMAQTGYLSSSQMSGAFQLLRAYDLVWSRMIDEYVLGDRRPMTDLMAWNADGTRLPAKMHSQYLRRLYLNNDLSAGRYPVLGRPVSVGNITVPMFCVGTASDHIAPWRSVYKLHLLSSAELTFVLTTGGHNGGIVSEPGRGKRQYQIHTRAVNEGYMAPDEWQATAQTHLDSWWPAWSGWLQERSGDVVAPPLMGSEFNGYPTIGDAPGEYVRS
ncbi:PHA/PHB synthase family protein [Stutzerimonas stutzeri]|uniref:Poly-beta-hydroxybutyrate polymerase n=1 Tax=Stutzerimonas stutzeri KOS6 TaxID=1218352 RepID=A0A061JQM7_STUST|nr:alpha/beta fold hydrolase [Stutzerimonas stutzeri]EWC42017.1 poly-beta-hydroxybutyrate polymerase [Stutzerimonas stutzeri KOS6]